MFYRREGFPEEGELVLVTVSKVQYHSVLARLDEYDRNGLIHISEISPGRIRNIRDYVVEGKKIVCIVLRINQERGYIDLSLRRVNDNQRRRKIEQIKQEQKAEKIIEHVARESKQDFKKLYDQITGVLFEHYEYVHQAFEEVVSGSFDPKKLKLSAPLTKLLIETIEQRISPPEVTLTGKWSLSTPEPDGVEVVKDALRIALKEGKDTTDVRYLGAGKYSMKIKTEDYKSAEKILDKITDKVGKHMEKHHGVAQFDRDEQKK